MNRTDYRLLVAVEDRRLRSLLNDRLKEAGYMPQETTPRELLEMPPGFGPKQEALILLDAGPDKARMHAIAERLYRDWSEQGVVLLVVFHPADSTDEDLFKIWSLDALWRYHSPQQLVTVNRSITEDLEASVREVIGLLPRITGEPAASVHQKPPQVERKAWRRFRR